MQPLLLVAVVLSAALLIRALRRGADRGRLVYAGTLLLTLVLIVFNKVGSPQFMVWLAPVIMVGLLHDRVRWRTPALLTLGIAATTFVIYPLFYTPLIHANPVMAAVLTTRNALLVALLVWTVRRIWQLGTGRGWMHRTGSRPGPWPRLRPDRSPSSRRSVHSCCQGPLLRYGCAHGARPPRRSESSMKAVPSAAPASSSPWEPWPPSWASSPYWFPWGPPWRS